MSLIWKLVLIHSCIALWVLFCLATIYGRMADRTYDARMSKPWLRMFLMPGRLAEREVWVRQQKMMAWIALVFSLIVYAVAMISVIRRA
jgi:hypothetical protein